MPGTRTPALQARRVRRSLTMAWGLAITCASATAATAAAAPPREFDTRLFTGLTAQRLAREDDATLDIDFDRVGGGLVRFAHCRDVQPGPLAQVQPSQATLAEVLRLNCLAVKRYAASQPANRSQLPARWSAAAVALLPADLMPSLVPAGAEASTGAASAANATKVQAGATLARQPGARHIKLAHDGTVQVTGADVVAQFHRLARADFDGDGSEDWLLRIDWAATQGDARGSALVLVARPAANQPARVLERLAR